MEVSCKRCNVYIPYDPFLCHVCDQEVCMNCIKDDLEGINLCTLCHAEQSQLVTVDKIKCTECQNNWIPKNMKCSCFSNIPIIYCSNCSRKCKVCSESICRQCDDICLKHGTYCFQCNNRYAENDLKKCKMCLDKFCRRGPCSDKPWPIMDKDPFICHRHVSKCNYGTCTEHSVSLTCQRYKCYTSSCTSCWFRDSTGNYSIRACHDHVGACGICCKFSPMIQDLHVKVNGDVRSCSNCYKRIYEITQGLAKNFPKDLVILITKICIKIGLYE